MQYILCMMLRYQDLTRRRVQAEIQYRVAYFPAFGYSVTSIHVINARPCFSYFMYSVDFYLILRPISSEAKQAIEHTKQSSCFRFQHLKRLQYIMAYQFRRGGFDIEQYVAHLIISSRKYYQDISHPTTTKNRSPNSKCTHYADPTAYPTTSDALTVPCFLIGGVGED